MAKKEKKMETQPVEETKPVVEETPKVPAVSVTELKQKQTVLNLDTMGEDSIELVYNKYVVNEKADPVESLKAMMEVVIPESKQAEALASFATSEAYRSAKKEALAKGNFLTTQLRSTIVGIMQNLPAFSELSAKECFERWLAGFKGQKQSALTLLDRAKAAIEGSEFSDL